jgi:hypothetical protein
LAVTPVKKLLGNSRCQPLLSALQSFEGLALAECNGCVSTITILADASAQYFVVTVVDFGCGLHRCFL